MNLKLRIASVVLLAALGTAFAFAAPAAARKFVSDRAHDYFGYYMPAAKVRTGKFVLNHLFIGTPADFKDFERGKTDKAFSAVMVEFDDVTSPKKTNEMGQEYFVHSIRVTATSYAVGGGKVHFEGSDKTLGAVTFDGVFAKDYFKGGPDDSPHPVDHPILRGTLKVGPKTFTVAFNWFGGD